MIRQLHIVLSCANRKQLAASPELSLRNVDSGPIAARVREWRRRFENSSLPRMKAIELYQGEYWSVVRSLPETAALAGYKPRLWVVSAGAGLISADDCLPPYSATFAYGHADSVLPRRSGTGEREWWAGVSQIKVNGNTVRTLERQLSAHPRAVFLIALSPEYLFAISDDLIRGLRGTSPRTIIVTSPSGIRPELEPLCIPSVGRLRARMGGTLASLHARVAHRMIEQNELELSPSDLKRKYARLAACTQPEPVRNAERLTDEEVKAFISEVRSQEPDVSATRCLRRLRDSGRACEQARFRDLFHQ
jgi:hypothetical protein